MSIIEVIKNVITTIRVPAINRVYESFTKQSYKLKFRDSGFRFKKGGTMTNNLLSHFGNT